MTRSQFTYQLFLYSVLLIAVGLAGGVLLQQWDDGWPKAKTRWAYPVTIVGFLLLILFSAVMFIGFLRELYG